uniref:Fibronectin type-III domain-containing protein n=1 Tax=Angiostrongylus cantonensis TaxID=6313 RepID=A0A0K0DEZ0_ANGCA
MEVFDVPSAPTNAIAKDIGSTKATISWNKPEFSNGSEITEYCVERKSVEYSRWRVVGRVPANCLSFTAHDLFSNDLYTFRVSAVNAIGHSKPSNTVDVETIEENEAEDYIEHTDEVSASRDVDENGELPEEIEEEFIVTGVLPTKTDTTTDLEDTDASEEITLKVPRQEVDDELKEKPKEKAEIVKELKKDEDLREEIGQEKETEQKPKKEVEPKEAASPIEKAKRKEEKAQDDKFKKEVEPREESKTGEELKPEERDKSKQKVEKDKKKEKKEMKQEEKITVTEEHKVESKEFKASEKVEEEVKKEAKPEERLSKEEELKPEEKFEPRKVKKTKEEIKKKKTIEEKAIPKEDHKQEVVEMKEEQKRSEQATQEMRPEKKEESEEEQKPEGMVEPTKKITEDKVGKKKAPKELVIPDEISTRFGEPSILHSETEITTKITAVEGNAEATSPIKQPQSASISMKVESAREALSKTEQSESDVFEFTFRKKSDDLDGVNEKMSIKLRNEEPERAIKVEQEEKKHTEDTVVTEKTSTKKKKKKVVQKEEKEQKSTPEQNGTIEKKDVEIKGIEETEAVKIPNQEDEPVSKTSGDMLDYERKSSITEAREKLPEVILPRRMSAKSEEVITEEGVLSATTEERTPQTGDVLSNLSSRRSSGASEVGSYSISRRKMRKSGFVSAPGPEMFALRGDTVRFECELVNEDDKVEWFINDKSYAAEPRSLEEADGPFRRLTIRNLTPEDTGMIVEVRLKENVVTSKLVVEEILAEITKRLDYKSTGEEGKPVTLTIGLDHPAKEVKWYKDNEEITESLKYDIGVKNNFCYLTIKKVEYENAGQYTVIADGSKSYTNLRILGKPRIKTTEHELVEIERNENIMLSATFDCQEEPTAMCLFNGEVLHEDAKTHLEVHQNTVKFCKRNATKADSGEYTIKLSNEFGEDLETFNVKVKDVPGAPSSISVKEVGSDTISIKWEKSLDDCGAPITGYIIEKKEDGRRTFHKVAQVSGSKTSYVVEELENATSYVLRVSAVNKYGPGEYIETPVVTTATPFMAPQIAKPPTISDITDDGCVLTWQKPLEDGGSPIYGYDVYRREDGGGWMKVNTSKYKHLSDKMGMRIELLESECLIVYLKINGVLHGE